MIAYLKGRLTVKTPSKIIMEVNGVGYELHVSLNTYSAFANQSEGQIFTYLHLFENGQTFYGFATEQEKEMFLLLIGVSGIGASTARMMLSGMKTEELARAIAGSDAKQLETIKGIGKKSAERLILELKDKLPKTSEELSTPNNNTNTLKPIENDAVNALISLGINKQQAEASVKKSILGKNEQTLEELIKNSLKNL